MTVSSISSLCKGNSLSTPTSLVSDLNPPHLNRIWIQGEPFKSDTAISSVSIISLPFGSNFFTVEFISINYNSQHSLQYGYQLIGIDSGWVYSGNQRRASYANLEPGIYPLKIKVSEDGWNWVQNTQVINVVVTHPFWLGWWYQFIVIIFIFFLLWVIYKIRVNSAIKQVLEIAEIRKKESESLRLMMAQDFHDEMGNKLASIIVLVSTLQILIKDKTKDVQKSLVRIENSSKQLFDGTKSFIWSINPDSDQLSEVVRYINNFGSELYEHTPISFSVINDISVEDKEIRLTVGNSRQLFFIMKEAMTNTLVHSKASNVKLSYAVDSFKNIFSISFEDDGNGVSHEQLNSSRGLNNMKTRASRIGYNLGFYHNPGGGFGVRIEGEFPKT
jgi:two-component sensor histidine kinase